MASPIHQPGGGRSRRESHSSRRSPAAFGIEKRLADDSEAETEILSANNTPAKPRRSAPMEPKEKFPELLTSKPQDEANETNDESMVEMEPEGGTLTISSRRDRRAATNETSEETAALVKQESSSVTSRKRTRLGRAVSMKSDEDEKECAEVGISSSPRLTRAQSSSNANLSSPPSTSTNDSKRAATQEPRSRSRSHSPRRSHKRSSSFHSALASANATRERKQRNRRTLRDESHALSPREEQSPSRFEQSPAGRLTPGQHGHSGHMPRKDNTGRTAFSKACERGSVADVKAHLEKPGASDGDLDEPDYAGNRPLQFAALKGHSDVVKVLIEHGCEYKDVKNAEGDTPLMDAISNGHKDIVKILLEAGVNPHPKNKKGRRAEDELNDLQDEEMQTEILALLTDARSKWKEEEREHAAAEHERRRDAKTVVPLITRGSRRNQHIRNDLLYVQASLPRLRQYAEDGDEEGARYLIKSGIVADNSCAIAAAARGHLGVLETLLTFGGAQSDPDPEEVGGQTPMMAAIAGGEIEIIRFLLNYGGFKPGRKVEGNTYEEYAIDQKGPRWQEVAQMLKRAVAGAGDGPLPKGTSAKNRQSSPEPPTRRRRLRTGREMAAARAEAPSSPALDDAMDIDDKSLESTAASTPQAMQNGSSKAPSPEPDPEPAPPSPVKTPPRPDTPPTERHRRYLSPLPRALARALSTSNHIHPHISKTNLPASIKHFKSLEDWMPIPIVRRDQIDPSCSSVEKHEAWMLGYYASVFLRHERLDDVVVKLGWETLEVSPAWREIAWLYFGIEQHIVIDADWCRAPQSLWNSCGIPINPVTLPNGSTAGFVFWRDVSKDSRAKWNDLPPSQCLFVRVADFLKATKTTPHLRNLIVRLDLAHMPGFKLGQRVCYQNGVKIEEPGPREEDLRPPEGWPSGEAWEAPPFAFWRGEYASFAERWVQREDGEVDWVTEDV